MSRVAAKVAMVLMAAAALAGCGKPHGPRVASSAPPAASSGAAVQATAAQPAAAPLSAWDLAGRLAKPGAFDLSGLGYAADGPLTCQGPGQGDDWGARCRVSLRDNDRGGEPAVVEIQLFDRDADFDTLTAPLKSNIAAAHQHWTLTYTPDITLKVKATGVTRQLPGLCLQALGPRNSPAFCAVMLTPRILVMTGVRPIEASSHSVEIGANAVHDANRDVRHADDLATLVLGQVDGVR
jgi:hypothetical protein